MAAPEMYRPTCEGLRPESGLSACVDEAYLLGRPVRESTSLARRNRDAVLAAATAKLTMAEPSRSGTDLADQDKALLAALHHDTSVVDVCNAILDGQPSATNAAGTIVAHRLSPDDTTSTTIVTNSRTFCALWRLVSEIPCEFYALLGRPTNFNVF